MYSDMTYFLEGAMLDDVRVEVTTWDGKIFSGFSDGLEQSNDFHLGWCFDEMMGTEFGCWFLKDIYRVKRLDTGEVFVQEAVAVAS
ncbi:MAG: hypothetical protein LBE35_03090 [Clostridiales bacterium]|jgi:hypothetical protein|nr:hypothetical protein [Clostridiales bacterium]